MVEGPPTFGICLDSKKPVCRHSTPIVSATTWQAETPMSFPPRPRSVCYIDHNVIAVPIQVETFTSGSSSAYRALGSSFPSSARTVKRESLPDDDSGSGAGNQPEERLAAAGTGEGFPTETAERMHTESAIMVYTELVWSFKFRVR